MLICYCRDEEFPISQLSSLDFMSFEVGSEDSPKLASKECLGHICCHIRIKAKMILQRLLGP